MMKLCSETIASFGQMTLRHSPVTSPLLKPKEYIITLVNPPICIIFKYLIP